MSTDCFRIQRWQWIPVTPMLGVGGWGVGESSQTLVKELKQFDRLIDAGLRKTPHFGVGDDSKENL